MSHVVVEVVKYFLVVVLFSVCVYDVLFLMIFVLLQCIINDDNDDDDDILLSRLLS